MDSTAFSLCLDNNVPILVFNLEEDHAIRKAVSGEKIGDARPRLGVDRYKV
ncbi:MAG: hypothetical protein WDM96_08820 [Lacunisphaera sp.]